MLIDKWLGYLYTVVGLPCLFDQLGHVLVSSTHLILEQALAPVGHKVRFEPLNHHFLCLLFRRVSEVGDLGTRRSVS